MNENPDLKRLGMLLQAVGESMQRTARLPNEMRKACIIKAINDIERARGFWSQARVNGMGQARIALTVALDSLKGAKKAKDAVWRAKALAAAHGKVVEAVNEVRAAVDRAEKTTEVA